MSYSQNVKQQSLALRTWGGRRRGAGRKPAGQEARLSHTARQPFGGTRPVHVTLRLLDRVWNLRSERSFSVIHGALADTVRRRDFRVVHFSIQGEHLHLIVEADGPESLSNGVRALAIRLSRRLNKMMGTAGPVFEDRFHAHVLRTPTEVRNALRYVLDNHRNHMRRSGVPVAEGDSPDPFSSQAARTPRGGQLELWGNGATRDAQGWLLRKAIAR